MSEPVRWGILGAANFARVHMGRAIHAAEGAVLHALATADADKAAGFAAFAPGLRHHASYEALLNDPEVEAVYIPLPNTLHLEWSLRAVAAGKHVLCEKPVAMTAPEIDRLIAARDAAGLLVAEAYMIVHHPQWLRARDLIAGGAVGPLAQVDGVFSYFNDDPANIRNQAALGGGALRDIGVYPIGATRFVTGAEPERLSARITRADGVDILTRVEADFPGFGFHMRVATRLAPAQEMTFTGPRGVLRLSAPFNAGVFKEAQITLEQPGQPIVIERFPGVNQYVLQVEAFGRTLRTGAPWPCPLEFSRGTQAVIDQVFAAA